MIKSVMRHALREIGQRFPWLRHYSGRLGLGRLVAPISTCEQIYVDGDVTIELDLGVPIFRYIYFHHDLSTTPEIALIRRLLSSSDIFVDVGAHIGYFALVAAKFARQVIAFEPGAGTFARLKRNLQLNPQLASRVLAYQLALSDHSGSAQLFSSAEHPDLASMQIPESSGLTSEVVQLDTLDHTLSPFTTTFIKIDVEGSELDVLNGGRTILRRDQPLVLCELFAPNQQRFSRTCQDIVDFFAEHDYCGICVRVTSAHAHRLVQEPLDLARLNSQEPENALFIPRARQNHIQALLSY